MSDLELNLKRALKDKEYRHTYADEFLNSYIAAQITALRKQRKWKQGDLAKRMGVSQPQVSVWEDASHGSWTITTMKKLAVAFDLRLVVKLESFSSMFDEMTLSKETLERPSFSDDPALAETNVIRLSAKPMVAPPPLPPKSTDGQMKYDDDTVAVERISHG